MNANVLGMATHLVRLWTRVYTYGLPSEIRGSRLSEIESDLWECQHDPDRPAHAREMLTRLLLGVPHDLCWRLEQAASASVPGVAPAPRLVRASAFTCSLAFHLVILTGMLWWPSWPADRSPSRAWSSPAPAIDGPALVAAASFAAAPSEREQAMKKAALLVGTIVATTVLPVTAQQPASEPAFEVASIRPNTSGNAGWMLQPQPGGRLTGTNVPAAALIRFAYDLPAFQVSGGPGWLDSERFDIAARAEGDPPIDQKRLMLRKLLAERFTLTTHTETRELPIYALVMARSDGRPGPQLRRSDADCAGVVIALDDWAGHGPAAGPPPCGFFGFSPRTDLPKGRGGFAFRGLTMGMFAKRLVPMVRRTVSDQTGVTGYFDGEFDFVAEMPPPPPPPGMPNAFGSDPFPTVFTVLPEQLGLKLDSRRGPVAMLVIDRVERPTPD